MDVVNESLTDLDRHMNNPKDQREQRLTLEIDGPTITAEKFAIGVSAFVSLIKEVAKGVSGKPKAVKWIVSVRPGSVNVDFSPSPIDIPESTIIQIIDTIENGINLIGSKSVRPDFFSDRALNNIHDLASILLHKDGELDKVRVWRNGTPTDLSTKTVSHVDGIFRTFTKDWGTIEGRLSVISERRGYKCFVYDPVTGKPTRCYFDDEILDEVVSAFAQRVSVSGLIRYRRDGEPISIKVETFQVLPKPESLPNIMDVYGILGKTK